jgi:putative thioredoxin
VYGTDCLAAKGVVSARAGPACAGITTGKPGILPALPGSPVNKAPHKAVSLYDNCLKRGRTPPPLKFGNLSGHPFFGYTGPAHATTQPKGVHYMDVTLANFEREVLLASRDLPVIVQFWSARSAACQQLAQSFAKLEQEHKGRFKLTRVDADNNPELVQHFQLRSLPFVIAFVNTQPVDSLTGAVSDAQAREFIERQLPSPIEEAYNAALQARQAGDLEAAEKHLKAALVLDPKFDDARFDYVEVLIETDRGEDAQAHFDRITPVGQVDPRHSALATILAARAKALELPEEDALIARIEQDPANLQARLELANLRIARRAWAGAMEELLEIVRRDRTFEDDIGRKTLIAVFSQASAQPELVSQTRRKLSTLLN